MESGGNFISATSHYGKVIIWWLGFALSIFLLIEEHYILSTTLLIGLAFLPLFFHIERSQITTRGIVMLAILAAVASVSRIPFAFIPNVQPATFIIIIAGIVFGKESGFIVGALTALVSNIFLGQGPWTPWQMLAWGVIGFCSGRLKNTWFIKKRFGQIVFGLLSGFFFGWIMNLWVVLTVLQELQLAQILFIYGSSFPFDLAHGLANIFFLLLFSKRMVKTLNRFKKKYGILYREN